MNILISRRTVGVTGWGLVGLGILIAGAVVPAWAGDDSSEEAVIISPEPLEYPREIHGGMGSPRVAEGAGLRPRRIGVICEPFREGSLRGVLLLAVNADSIAERLGLEQDDVIVSVNSHPVKTPHELSLALATATGPIRLRVRNCRTGEIIWLRNTFKFPGGQAASTRAEESYEEEDLQDPEPGAGQEG
jgi:membrane-associated protease RseP (regulator of RpoE activity)